MALSICDRRWHDSWRGMEVIFATAELDRLETDVAYEMGLAAPIVKAYRKRLQAIRAAADERDLHAFKSWHFEKLKRPRQHQHSIRLNDQYRLIVQLVGAGNDKRVRIEEIVDYH